MAVYTDVNENELSAFLKAYPVGELLSYKGIAEGVENSNFLLHAGSGSFILTLYEKRVERAGAAMSLLVQRAAEIPWDEIGRISTLGLSAGASAPEIIVDEIIAAFGERFDVTVELAETAIETEDFPVMRALRDVELTAADMAFVNGNA